MSMYILIFVQGIPKQLCPVCVATVEELQFQLSRFLHICRSKASTWRPCLSQCDKWLLIYGRKRQNKWLLEKQHRYCSPAMSK